MGRESTITTDQVHAAANAIRAEGGKATLRAVRERLGTGSMGTVSRHLQAWQAQQTRQATADLALPPALQRALLDFMASEMAATRAPLEADLVEAQQATTDLAAENERLGSQIDAQALELDALAADKAAAEGRSEQLSADLAALKAEAARERAAAELARTELAKAQLRLDSLPRLEADLDAARTELAAQRQARAQSEQQAAVLASQLSDAQRRADEASHLVEQERSARVLATERAERASVEAAELRGRLDGESKGKAKTKD